MRVYKPNKALQRGLCLQNSETFNLIPVKNTQVVVLAEAV